MVALVLYVLWVRSYTTWDRCYWPGSNLGVQLNSDAGHIVLVVGPHVPSSNIVSFFVASRPTLVTGKTFYKDNVLGFYFERRPSGFRLDLPSWFLVLLGICIAAVPWLRYVPRRFSLRTLLIATTLVAVVLGLVVWLSK